MTLEAKRTRSSGESFSCNLYNYTYIIDADNLTVLDIQSLMYACMYCLEGCICSMAWDISLQVPACMCMCELLRVPSQVGRTLQNKGPHSSSILTDVLS